MKKIIAFAALILLGWVPASAQKFTQTVNVPLVGDTIIEMTTEVLPMEVAAGETLKTLDLVITQKTKDGWVRTFNKTVPNDTALANKLRTSIIKEAIKK